VDIVSGDAKLADQCSTQSSRYFAATRVSSSESLMVGVKAPMVFFHGAD
jgi:hypothetical protein